MRTSLYPHQRAALEFLESQPAAMLHMDMGTGKTLIGLERSRGLRSLVLAPKSVGQVWVDQARRHYEHYPILSLCDGELRRRVELFDATARDQLMIVVNYEAAIREPLKSRLLQSRWDVIIADESHRLKSPTGVTARWAMRLRQCSGARIALTGTPMPHSPIDIFAQMRYLNGVLGDSWYAFRARYCILGGYENHEIIAYRYLDDLMARIAPYIYRVKLDDVVDMPERIVSPRYGELCGELRRVYETLRRYYVAQYREHIITAANCLVRLLRLQQITSGILPIHDSGPSTDAEDVQLVTGSPSSSPRAILLNDLLDDCTAQEPLVIFARFRPEIAAIRQILESRGYTVYEVSGDRHEVQGSYSAAHSTAVVCQYRAGSLGLDFSGARLVVLYSCTWSLGEMEQAIARVYRPGCSRVVIVPFIIRGTIDEDMYSALEEKRDIVEAALKYLEKGDAYQRQPI